VTVGYNLACRNLFTPRGNPSISSASSLSGFPHIMPFFDRAAHPDINDSVFNDVGHDQNIISDSVVNEVGRNQNNISDFIIIGSVSFNLVSAPEHDYPRPVAHSPPPTETSSRKIVLRPTFHSAAGGTYLVAPRLVVEIVQSLMVLSASDQFRHLKEDLIALKQTLDFTGLAIEAYQCTPIGRILARTISEETVQCIEVLRDLLSAIRGYERDFRSTRRFFPSSRASGSGREFGEIRIWREKLSASQKSLGQCLLVLDSCVLRFFHTLASLKQRII
jgi:hypothetical protein